jgi:hypothetical protein
MASTGQALTPGRVRAARTVAIAADFLQIVVFPVFAPGIASIVNDALDVAVALLMLFLVGWHWAFLPTFAAELIPLFDLVPTWSAAVFFVTRGAGGPKAAAPSRNAAEGAIDAKVVSSSPVPNPESGGRSVM